MQKIGKLHEIVEAAIFMPPSNATSMCKILILLEYYTFGGGEGEDKNYKTPELVQEIRSLEGIEGNSL